MPDIDPIESALIPKFLQIPHRDGGRGFDGANCLGVILLWYKYRLGIELWDIEEDYRRDWKNSHKDFFLENYYRQWMKVDHPQRYDVVVFRRSGKFDHAGIYLRDDKFLHMSKSGCIVARLSSPAWSGCLEGIYRLKIKNENPS